MPKQSLLEKVQEKETEEVKAKAEKEKRKPAVKQISKTNFGKDQQISAKVNSTTYEQFKQINQILGVSNNSALNLCITKYVRENRGILDD